MKKIDLCVNKVIVHGGLYNNMRKKIYIHYGSSRFDLEKFRTISNEENWVKPNGGLWASPINAPRGWKEFVNENNMKCKNCEDSNSFRFTLSDNANVVHLYSVSDLDNLPQMDSVIKSSVCLNFEKMLSDGVDAIEVHLSEERIHHFMDSLYWKLYGWDCDSILIMNPDIIIQANNDESEIQQFENYLERFGSQENTKLKELLLSGKSITIDEFKECVIGIGGIDIKLK